MVSSESFLITREYLIAFFVGLAEYFIEIYCWPDKVSPTSAIVWLGLILTIIGLVIRFAAIIHAKQSFTHEIQENKREEHKLITDGIYKYIRHPGYLGFYIFAVGTQVFLKNPISIIIYAGVLWYFFYDRIDYEQKRLIRFFGKDYENYMAKTPTYFPFISLIILI